MAFTYAELQTRIALILDDVGATKFDSSDIQDGIKSALDHYSKRRPLQQVTTLTATDSREQDASGITGIIDVSEVWCPYDSTNPEDPPLVRSFRYWQDQQTIYFEYPYRPVSGDIIRVFYQKLHTLNGLDSETVTTIPLDDESPFAMGAAGYAAQARARVTTETVNIDSPVSISAQVLKWAQTKIKELDAAIDRTLEREAGLGIVSVPRLDRYERAWS